MASSQELFNNSSSIINQLHFGRTQEERNILAKALDDLNSLNYTYTIVTNYTKATLLINQCSTFIQPDDESLVRKFSQVLRNLINRQNVTIQGRTWTVTLQWCLNCLQIDKRNITVHILSALDALLRKSTPNVPPKIVTSQMDAVIKRYENDPNAGEVILWAINCLEACTILEPSETNTQDDFDVCIKVFLHYLCNNSNVDEINESKIFIVCLLGLQNVAHQKPDFLKHELGLILGIVKSYMLFGLKKIAFIPPTRLMPSTLNVPDMAAASVPREKKGGKIARQRKPRVSSKKSETNPTTDWLNDNKASLYFPAISSPDSNLTDKLKPSDSDFSDSEGGKLANLSISNGRVRQAALNLFDNVVKESEKPVIFSYWSNFIPEANSLGKHNLITCILLDSSARSRFRALNVLLRLLTNSKLYLAQAEITGKITPFTPFSVLLGLTLKELHSGLCLALTDVSVPVLTEVLKCLGALVQCTPYHHMPTGLVTKVIRNVKPFISHKDISVQGPALMVLGCILASEPTVPETVTAFLTQQSNETTKKPAETSSKTDLDFDVVDFSSDEESVPHLPENSDTPWLLERCLSNINGNTTILPQMKFESLKLLCAMSRNYFTTLMAPNLHLITKSLECMLNDILNDVKLHAGRCVDFIGNAICKYFENNVNLNPAIESNCLLFWQTLLNDSLIGLLKNEELSVLRAIGCDCLGSIGRNIFEQLPRDRQIFCVTLLFSCAREEANNVKGAAVRALAISVLYPSLREDIGFVIDLCDVIYNALNDDNSMVRIKASWSLANLTDALVVNHQNGEDLEELTDDWLFKLLKSSLNGAMDNDKMKMNCVRALGNLMQLINESKLNNEDFKAVCEEGMTVFLKHCTTGSNMKVRWNSCYALGNVMKNATIYRIVKGKTFEALFNALIELVVSFRNFKVRINAALALASPTRKEYYGSFYVPLWGTLFKALENSQQIDDFMEYNHRDHLVDQICLTLAHFASLIGKDELLELNEKLLLFMDLVKSSMGKVMDRLLPEKASIILKAASHLQSLSDESLSQEEKVALDNLLHLFAI